MNTQYLRLFRKIYSAIAMGIINVLLLGATTTVYAQCIDFTNTGINASDPNTIMYDRMMSPDANILVREKDGNYYMWGSYTLGAGPGKSPRLINSTNYPGLVGTPLLASVVTNSTSSNVLGITQFIFLTTDGLYVYTSSASPITGITMTFCNINLTQVPGLTTGVMQKVSGIPGANSYGLPTGITPADVKIMVPTSNGSFRIVTCSGDVYIVSNQGTPNNFELANGALLVTPQFSWVKAKIDATTYLSGVVALRAGNGVTFALTNTGKLYTWGSGGTYLGDGSAVYGGMGGGIGRSYATEMVVPAGETPKMIGLTPGGTPPNVFIYYLLTTSGKLYAIGNQMTGAVGTHVFSNSAVITSWTVMKKDVSGTALFDDVAYIDAQCRGGILSGVNIITQTGKLWTAGGFTSTGTAITSAGLGIATASNNGTQYYNHPQLTGGLLTTDKVMEVASGGRNTLIRTATNDRYGIVGPLANGILGYGYDLTSSGLETPYYIFTAQPAGLGSGGGGAAGVGTITCNKTQISTAPVVGTAGQHNLIVTLNVTTAGSYPLTVSGSGMSLANGVSNIVADATGTKTFSVPLKYDGSALGTLSFTVGAAGSCTADLTGNTKKVITDVWTLDNCTAIQVGPDLK